MRNIVGSNGKDDKNNDYSVILELPHGKQRITFSKWAVGRVEKKGKETKNQEVIEEVVEETTEDKNKEEKY